MMPPTSRAFSSARMAIVSAGALRVWMTIGFFTSRARAIMRRKRPCCTSRGEWS